MSYAGSISLALSLAIAPLPSLAGDAVEDSLYQTTAVTNGFGKTNRDRVLGPMLETVLVKASGDQRLFSDKQVARIAEHASDYFRGFVYRDFLNGRPPNHEQGTYDRPQYLTAEFDPKAVDNELASLGRRPWPAPRPKIVAFIDIYPMKGDDFVLAGAGQGVMAGDMRSALATAADAAGIRIILPSEEAVVGFHREKPDADTFGALAKGLRGDVALVGSLTWNNATPGWTGSWQLAGGDKPGSWEITRVGFDDAFRNAVRGAAQILSGNGKPETLKDGR